jgi:hypothetical protein
VVPSNGYKNVPHVTHTAVPHLAAGTVIWSRNLVRWQEKLFHCIVNLFSTFTAYLATVTLIRTTQRWKDYKWTGKVVEGRGRCLTWDTNICLICLIRTTQRWKDDKWTGKVVEGRGRCLTWDTNICLRDWLKPRKTSQHSVPRPWFELGIPRNGTASANFLGAIQTNTEPLNVRSVIWDSLENLRKSAWSVSVYAGTPWKAHFCCFNIPPFTSTQSPVFIPQQAQQPLLPYKMYSVYFY